jgi:hypothetical protein
MDLEQLMGRYFRLKRELEDASNATNPRPAQVERLIGDLAVTRRQIAATQPRDEQYDDPFLSFSGQASSF